MKARIGRTQIGWILIVVVKCVVLSNWLCSSCLSFDVFYVIFRICHSFAIQPVELSGWMNRRVHNYIHLCIYFSKIVREHNPKVSAMYCGIVTKVLFVEVVLQNQNSNCETLQYDMKAITIPSLTELYLLYFCKD